MRSRAHSAVGRPRPSWPSVSSPQQKSEPWAVSAQVCRPSDAQYGRRAGQRHRRRLRAVVQPTVAELPDEVAAPAVHTAVAEQRARVHEPRRQQGNAVRERRPPDGSRPARAARRHARRLTEVVCAPARDAFARRDAAVAAAGGEGSAAQGRTVLGTQHVTAAGNAGNDQHERNREHGRSCHRRTDAERRGREPPDRRAWPRPDPCRGRAGRRNGPGGRVFPLRSGVAFRSGRWRGGALAVFGARCLACSSSAAMILLVGVVELLLPRRRPREQVRVAGEAVGVPDARQQRGTPPGPRPASRRAAARGAGMRRGDRRRARGRSLCRP
jgi:hypothetical protein